jgi:hypothetical protein
VLALCLLKVEKNRTKRGLCYNGGINDDVSRNTHPIDSNPIPAYVDMFEPIAQNLNDIYLERHGEAR